jgi:hypothetical protein
MFFFGFTAGQPIATSESAQAGQKFHLMWSVQQKIYACNLQVHHNLKKFLQVFYHLHVLLSMSSPILEILVL